MSEINPATNESQLVQPPTYDLKLWASLRQWEHLNSLARKERRKQARALGYRPSRCI
ncbi:MULTISPECIES: hypothetical protein [Bosea]|uniref:hypothetical protein n=1 Tax=Bosea TaxID=85413 RepID=UPI0012E3D637|nr:MULTISPECIES: hypothetical protein [Bosea]